MVQEFKVKYGDGKEKDMRRNVDEPKALLALGYRCRVVVVIGHPLDVYRALLSLSFSSSLFLTISFYKSKAKEENAEPPDACACDKKRKRISLFSEWPFKTDDILVSLHSHDRPPYSLISEKEVKFRSYPLRTWIRADAGREEREGVIDLANPS